MGELFDTSPRNGNGVKTRRDGRGDAWAAAHRDELGSRFLMQDVDASFGALVFGHNTGEKLFLEYVPDDYQNRTKATRDFAVVAMFDRKNSEAAAFANSNLVSRAFYLWQCRVFGTIQPIPPRFYYVIGNQQPPWRMVEIDILSSKQIATASVSVGDWTTVWSSLGLIKLRNELVQWIST